MGFDNPMELPFLDVEPSEPTIKLADTCNFMLISKG
jgi:hypothetical protein